MEVEAVLLKLLTRAKLPPDQKSSYLELLGCSFWRSESDNCGQNEISPEGSVFVFSWVRWSECDVMDCGGVVLLRHSDSPWLNSIIIALQWLFKIQIWLCHLLLKIFTGSSTLSIGLRIKPKP